LLTVDTVPVAHEYSLGIQPSVGRRSVRTKVRGYAWGNILSAAHLVALGGPARVRTEAPVAQIVDVGNGSENSLYLQLTPSIDHVPDDALRELKRYLLPLLDTSPRQSWVVGPKLRIV
jgi:hypothetical protein